MYCRSNQRRGGVQYTFCRACGVGGALTATSLTQSLSPPLLSTCLPACFLPPCLCLCLCLFTHACAGGSNPAKLISCIFGLDLVDLIDLLSLKRDGPHVLRSPPPWQWGRLHSTLCETAALSIAFLVGLPFTLLLLSLKKQSHSPVTSNFTALQLPYS